MRIEKIGLSANNKFYLDFGKNPSFKFFKAWPVSDSATIIEDSGEKTTELPTVDRLVHGPCWGVATVVSTTVSEVPIGAKFMAQLPLANQVHLGAVKVLENGDIEVIRPDTNPAYNLFVRLKDSAMMAACSSSDDSTKAEVALVASPGSSTGFGLYHQLAGDKFYRSKGKPDGDRVVVVTSASSKVALMFAFYLKQVRDKDIENEYNVTLPTKLIGYTSAKNKEWVVKTGLYDEVLSFDEAIPSSSDDASTPNLILIDMAGRGDVYKANVKRIVKAYSIGNTSSSDGAASTFSSFSISATLKLILTFSGMPYVASFFNPKLELFLIFDVVASLTKKWGKDQYDERSAKAADDFVNEAVDKKWITCRRCETMDEIRSSYHDILAGNVPPSEAVIFNVGKAVEKFETSK